VKLKCSGGGFTESGYNAIAIRQNNAEMKCFIKKFIQSCGGYVKSEPDLESMVPFHSGERTVQSFLSLKNELVAHASKKDAWLVLPSLVYKGWETETMADILSSEMFTTLRSLATLATESFMVTHATLSSAASTPPSRDSLVRHASNLGYEAVQAARNNTAMVEFIEFLVAGAGGDIVDPSQLRIVADRYSGIREERTWDRLWEDLQDMRWLPNGTTASLTEVGYNAVGVWRDNLQMEAFIRRVIAAQGGQVLNEDGLMDFVPYFSGDLAWQSLKAIRAELPVKAKTEKWVTFPEAQHK